MVNSLPTVIKKLALAKTEAELRSTFMDTVGNYLEVQRWGIYLLDDQSNKIPLNKH